MGCACSAVARGILIAFNLIFFICGTALVFFGLIGILGKNSMTNIFQSTNPEYAVVSDVTRVPDLLMNASLFMIVLGAIIMIFALIGCVGVSTELRALLVVYAILVAIVLIAEIALIVFAVVLPSKYKEKSEDMLYDSLKDHYKSVSITEIMDPASGRIVAADGQKASWLLLELKFSCCGAHNYSDYQTFDWNRTISLSDGTHLTAVVPFSCCKNPIKVGDSMMRCLRGEVEEINTEGCYKALTKLIMSFSRLPVIIAAASIAVEILLLGASIQLLGGCPGCL